jgi:hypothetical protein
LLYAAAAILRPRRWPSRRILVLLVILTSSAWALWTFHLPLFANNLGVVDAGRVYRSAQPGANLDAFVRQHRIAAVLNLRGGWPRDPYYRNELDVAARHGIQFFDLAMSAVRRPDRHELLALIDLFRAGPFPLLIHCKQGADRTGLAAAIYRMVSLNQPPERAFDAFTLTHAHIPAFGTQRLHEPLREYADFLAARRLAHSPEQLRDWVLWSYEDEDPPGVEPSPLEPGPRAEVRAALAARAARERTTSKR